MSIIDLKPTNRTCYVIRGWIRVSHNKYEWRYAEFDECSKNIEWEEQWSSNRISDEMTLEEREDLLLDAEESIDWDPIQYCEMIKITESRSFDLHDTASDRATEIRRNRALAKLTQSEIKLLGLEKFAVYDKLKFHNADEVEENGR
jgi:metal-sulfur cluster biosynthetic enzyme